MANFNDPNGDYNPYAPPAAINASSSLDEDEVLIPAERGTRWWARLVDGLLVLLAALPAGIVWGAMKQEGGLLLILVGFALYVYQWYLVSTTGQTIAKKWMNIKVVKMDGSPCGFVHGVLLREWVFHGVGLIPYAGTAIGLLDGVMIFGEQRRCLHDQLAGTQVVLALNLR